MGTSSRLRQIVLTIKVFLMALPVFAAEEGGQSSGLITESGQTAKKIMDWLIESAAKYGLQALGGIIVLFLGWLVAKFICRFINDFLHKHHVDVTVTKFVVGAVRLAIMALAALVALGKFGIEIAPFIAGLSVVGFGTSFALQGPLSNYASGATLIFTKPFRVGDIIEVAGVTGEVQDITLPRTIVKTLDDTTVVVPNKHIIGEIITNYSELKRVDFKVGVSYKADIDKAIGIIDKEIKKDDRIHRNQDAKVGISEFGDSSVNLYARLWCKQKDYWDVLFGLNKKVFDAFKSNGIEIPFPQRDVHILKDLG